MKIGVWKTIIVKKDLNTERYEGPYYANRAVTRKAISKWDKEKTIWKDEEWKHTEWKYYIEDDWVSPHLEQLLYKLGKDSPHNKIEICQHLLKMFDEHWDIYKDMIKTRYYYRNWRQQGWSHDLTKSTFYLTLLNSTWLPTTQNTLAKPLEVFLDKAEIREVLGDTVPYLAVKIENEDLIRTLCINMQANVGCVLNYLKALIERKSEDKKKFEKLYKFLDEHFEEDPVKIKDAFREHPLIFVPGTNNKYHRADEVLWKDVSNIFGENRVYLEKYYPKLKKFFLEKLEIRENPTPKDYADVLCSISEKSNISDEDKEIIIKIYEELNHNLNPNKVENPIYEEDWWGDFITEPIFLIDKDEFWFNNGDIFINDDEELYNLFKDKGDIGFLWLPDGYNPDKIKFFIKACNLPYLSENIEIEPLVEKTKVSIDDKHTQLIQDVIPYVLRYLYRRENEEYGKLKENGVLEKIGAIEVYVTNSLRVKYSINVDELIVLAKEAERTCVYHKDKNCIYMKSDGSIYDLSVEFYKVFGKIKGLDDFIMNVMSNIHNAENIMKAKKIGLLPKSEEKILKMISRIKEIETTEKAEKEKQLSESKLGEGYSAEEKVEAEKITQIPVETSTQQSSESAEETVISTDEDILDETKEKEWTPEFTPEDISVNVEEYAPKEVKSSGQKSSNKFQTTYADRARATEFLSKKIKEEIGRWGEQYAFRCIKDEMMKKYPDTSLLETERGFKLEKDGNVIVEAVWLNKNGESGEHYDIEITENGDKIFIEVKSTKEYGKTCFQMSKDQWNLMKEKGDKYYIYRVYGAGTKNAKLEKISNPAKLWKEGLIDAYPIYIEI